MSFDDVKFYFSRIQISKVNDTFVFSSLPVEVKETQSLWHLKIADPGNHTFSVSQICERMFPRYSGYNYSHVRMFLIEVNTSGDSLKVLRFINAVSDIRERDTYLECNDLKEGEYFLYIEVDWQQESAFASNHFCITCYGVSKVSLNNITTKYDKEDILRKTCSVMVKQSSGVGEITVDVAPQAPNLIKTTLKTDFKYLIYHYDNQASDLDYHEKQQFVMHEGIKLCKPYEGQTSYSVSVKANTQSIVLIRLDATGYQYQGQISYRTSLSSAGLIEKCMSTGKMEQKGEHNIF